jgi:pimeloyl-ACP methyl ester carboxylesterase
MCSMSISPRQGFLRTDDGVELFYRVVGEGQPALVCCNGVGVSTFFWKYLSRRFAGERAVVTWDYRGHNRSGIPGPDQRVDIPRMAQDLGTIVDGLALERPVFLGHSMGAQVILERYRQAPDSVGGLVSVLGTAGHPLDTFGGLRLSRTLFDLVLATNAVLPRGLDSLAKILLALPGAYDLARLAKMVDGGRLSRHDLRQYLHQLTDMGTPLFCRMLEELGEHTAWDVLPTVAIPTLVIAAEFDGFTPPELAHRVADALPDSEFLMLDGASHAGIVEQPERINEAVADWLGRRILA